MCKKTYGWIYFQIKKVLKKREGLVGYPTDWRSVKVIKDENKQTIKKKVLKRGGEGDTKWEGKVAVIIHLNFSGVMIYYYHHVPNELHNNLFFLFL